MHPNTSSLYTSAGLSAGAGAQQEGSPITWVCVCTQGKNILGKIAFTVELDLTQNCRARHTLGFDRSWHNLLGTQTSELVLSLHSNYHCLLSCTLPSLWMFPSLTFPHNYFPRHWRFPRWRGWPKNPVSEHLHGAVPAQNMLTGTGKLTAQIATDGKYLLHIEQEGVGSGKAVALARAPGVTAPGTPSTACRDVSQQELSAFPRLLHPSPWLAGILQPVPAFCGSSQPGSGHRQQMLGGAMSGSRSWAWVRRSTSQMLPRNVPWRDFSWGGGKVCGTTLWRYHHHHELMRSHPGSCESLVRLRAAEPGPSCIPGCAGPTSPSVEY